MELWNKPISLPLGGNCPANSDHYWILNICKWAIVIVEWGRGFDFFPIFFNNFIDFSEIIFIIYFYWIFFSTAIYESPPSSLSLSLFFQNIISQISGSSVRFRKLLRLIEPGPSSVSHARKFYIKNILNHSSWDLIRHSIGGFLLFFTSLIATSESQY